MIEFDLRQAFREARTPPQGAALVEIPTNILYHQDDPATAAARRDGLRAATSCGRRPTRPRSSAPLELLRGAERPLIAAGDGIFWSDAAAELRELAELRRACRSTAAGRRRAPSPRTTRWPCAGRGRSRSPAAPTWCSPSASSSGAASISAQRRPGTSRRTYIQIDPTPARIGWQVPAERRPRRRPEARAAPADRRGAASAAWTSPRRVGRGCEEVAQARANYERMLDEREQRHAAPASHPSRPPGARALPRHRPRRDASSSTPSP